MDSRGAANDCVWGDGKGEAEEEQRRDGGAEDVKGGAEESWTGRRE